MQFGFAFFWDWVKASRMPWVATTYPADGQPQTHKHTAFFDRLDGVTGAGRVKPAGLPEPWADKVLVTLKKYD